MRRVFLMLGLLLCVSSSFGQTYFSDKIQDLWFSDYNTPQTWNFKRNVTVDKDDSIVFLAHNWTSYFDIELLKLDATGTYLRSKKILWQPDAELYPVDMIRTYDDGFLIVGDYLGAPPLSYPFVPGGYTIRTIFYAKFDNDLNLISLQLNHGYPLSSYSITGYVYQYCRSVVSFLDNGVENYIVLSDVDIEAYNPNNLPNAIVLTKLDAAINPIDESYFPKAQGMDLGNSVDYLPSNDLFALNGFKGALGGFAYPVVTLFDKNLDYVRPLTSFPTLVGNNILTNVLENPNYQDRIIWGYNTLEPTIQDCDDVPSLTNSVFIEQYVSNLYISNAIEVADLCMTHFYPVELSYHPQSPSYFGAGMSSSFGTLDANDAKAGLMNLSTYTLIPVTLSKFTDGTFTSDSGEDEEFHSLMRYNNAGNGTSYVSLVNGYNNVNGAYVRVVNSDVDGVVDCSINEDFSYLGTNYDIEQVVIDYNEWGAKGYDFEPDIISSEYFVDPCTSLVSKPVVATKEQTPIYRIYPNPSTSGLVYIQGNIPANSLTIVENSIGQLVYKGHIAQGSKASIDLRHIAPGLYIIKMLTGNTVQKVEKLIIN